MSMCIEIPQCVELKSCTQYGESSILCINMVNKCDYDLVVFLYLKDKQGLLLHSISTDLRALEEKNVELPIEIKRALIVSGEWSLKGTSLRLPLKELTLNL